MTNVDALDHVDRALVERLRVDGRESNRSLSEALGIGESAVANRIRRLEETSVMRVVAVTDLRVFGHEEFAFAMLQVRSRSPIEVSTEIAQLSETLASTAVFGRCNVIVPLLARHRRHLDHLFGTSLPRVSGVESVNGHLVLEVLKFDSTWGVLAASPGPMPELLANDVVDGLDLRILDKLQMDARRSFRSVAGELAVSERTIRDRVKRLVVNHVIRIQAVSDVFAFGITANAYVGLTVGGGHTAAVAQALIGRAEVAQLNRTLGEYDFIAIVIATDRSTLMQSVFDGIVKIPGVLRVDVYESWQNTKHNFAWNWLV